MYPLGQTQEKKYMKRNKKSFDLVADNNDNSIESKVLVPINVTICRNFCKASDNACGYGLIMETSDMLYKCGISPHDIVLTLALTLCQIENNTELFAKCSGYEYSYTCVLQIYLAHCWLLDETCSIVFWHKEIFYKYSTYERLAFIALRLLNKQTSMFSINDKHVIIKANLLLDS